MARITWQNVTAPDFETSRLALAQAGRSFLAAWITWLVWPALIKPIVKMRSLKQLLLDWLNIQIQHSFKMFSIHKVSRGLGSLTPT